MSATADRSGGAGERAAVGLGGSGLARQTMGPVEVLAQSVSAIAPSAVMATGPVLIVLSAGNGTWLSYAAAAVLVLLIGLCVVQYGARVASTGSLYSYVAKSLGPGSAFAAGWGLVIGYAFIAIVGVAGVGIYGASLLDGAGVDATTRPAQLLLFLLAAAAATAFAVAGIKISTRLGLVLELVSVTCILILMAVVLGRHGVGDAAQTHLAGSTGNGVTFGIVLATLGFVGFESSAALGAEARDPHRAIPRAVISSACIVGVLYVFAAYVTIKGLGADALSKSTAPMDDLAKVAGLTGFRYVIDLGVVMSFFAVIIASINAAARVLYTMAHEQVLAAALSHTHTKHRTPHVAILTLVPVVLLVPVGMLLYGTTPFNIYAYTGTIGTFGYLTAYLLMAAGMPVFLRRRGLQRPQHVVLAAAAVLTVLYVVYKNLVPRPPSPYNVLPYLYLAMLVAGLLWYLSVRMRGVDRVRHVGTFEEEARPLAGKSRPGVAAP